MKNRFLFIILIVLLVSVLSVSANNDWEPGKSTTIPGHTFLMVGNDIPAGSYIVSCADSSVSSCEVMIIDDVYTQITGKAFSLPLNPNTPIRIYFDEGTVLITETDNVFTVADPFVFE